MNTIINKFLLAGDNFMPDMHLKQPGFSYSDSRPYKKKQEYKNSKKQEAPDISTGMSQKRPASNMI